MNKSCLGCPNTIFIDEKNVQPAKKFCSKVCYLNFVKRKPEEKIQERNFLSKLLLSCKKLIFKR